ncbi:MAG: hypothetical protein GY953_24500, partial [bacterium]|nr:hypothetical protein [bacterium]
MNQPAKISATELEKALEQAREEAWPSLALLSPEAAHWYLSELPPDRTYIIDALPIESVRTISKLTDLTSLWLVDLEIRAEGARALASLTALTSL